MPYFGSSSKNRLDTCCDVIQETLNMAIKYYDFSVIDGHRSRTLQTLYFNTGKSKLQWPSSKHNTEPSEAVDIVPWINNKSCYGEKECIYLSGVIGMCFHVVNEHRQQNMLQTFKLRWGGDWDGDRDFDDQTLMDLVHFEVSC